VKVNHALSRETNGRFKLTAPRFALFNIFLPQADEPDRFAELERKINGLVASTGASGYTLLPASLGMWINEGRLVADRIQPMQIVAQDTAATRAAIERFALDAAELLNQQWIYVFRVPVVVNQSVAGLALK
jgi:hypothetical protein